MSKGTIKKVAGPLVIAEGMRDANMFDVVRVSSQRLIGEIIEMHGDEASIQVYEETSGLGPGEPVESMEVPLSVELGPGLIASIYDGIQRPLDDIMKISGNNLKRGVEVPSLKRDRVWHFVPVAKAGDQVSAGDVLGTVARDRRCNPEDHGALRRQRHGQKRSKPVILSSTDTIAVLDCDGKERPADHAAEVAGPPGPPVSEEAAPGNAAGHRPARHRHVLPHRQRRCGRRSRPLRQRQDGHPAPAGQMGGGGYRRLHRLRRARQRDDGRSERIPRPEGPEDRPIP